MTELEKMSDGIFGRGEEKWKTQNILFIFDLKCLIWNKVFNVGLTQFFPKQYEANTKT